MPCDDRNPRQREKTQAPLLVVDPIFLQTPNPYTSAISLRRRMVDLVAAAAGVLNIEQSASVSTMAIVQLVAIRNAVRPNLRDGVGTTGDGLLA